MYIYIGITLTNEDRLFEAGVYSIYLLLMLDAHFNEFIKYFFVIKISTKIDVHFVCYYRCISFILITFI